MKKQMAPPIDDCPFCNPTNEIVLETEHCLAFKDHFPVSPGHVLIIPKVHRVDFFDLTDTEKTETLSCLTQLKAQLQKEDPSIDGFNIGMNCGASAGQSIFHCHVHLIPRRSGDSPNPKGGVRGVIPNKQSY